MRRPMMAIAGAVLLLAGCGTGSHAPETSAPGTSQGATSAATPDPAPPSEPVTPAEDPREVLELVRATVRQAGSVRLAVGNLNPPPTTFLQQDYASPDGDLELRVELAPQRPVLAVRRVDGRLLLSQDGGEFEPVPMPEFGEDDTGLLGRVLQTTPADELDALLTNPGKVSTAPDLVGDVDGAAAAYRLLVATDDLVPADRDALVSVPWLGLPDRLPVTLWLAADGLPLRLEARYADPLDGVEGTGTVRIDYSGWGEPIELEAP